MIIFHFRGAILAALVLSGCTDKISDEDLICDPSPGFIGNSFGDQPATSDKQMEQANDCIHKWGYRLGRAPGPNSEIAKATIGKCRVAIDNFLDLKIKEGNSLKKPLTDDAWQGYKNGFEEDALVRVVQGRAGNCSIRGEEQK